MVWGKFCVLVLIWLRVGIVEERFKKGVGKKSMSMRWLAAGSC
jgi:hypothetical protein